jgi:hypothetical protein
VTPRDGDGAVASPARPAPVPGRHRPGTGGPAVTAGPLTFGTTVLLTKAEVFGACQALADADRLLLRFGGTREASALGDLFELLEQRLAVGPAVSPPTSSSRPPGGTRVRGS